jgi:hypothetical protein
LCKSIHCIHCGEIKSPFLLNNSDFKSRTWIRSAWNLIRAVLVTISDMITAVVITVDDDLAMCGTSRSSYDSARIIASLDNFADIFRASGICLEPEVPSLDFIRFYQRLSDPSTFVELPKIGRISQIILTNLERN